MRKNKGQVLVGALLILAVLAIIVPIMVMYVRNEAKWSVKQGQNSNAFQLAEAALERGHQKATESTTTWKSLMDGQALPGFNASTPTAYTELPGGSYVVYITSGPGPQSITIIGLGRDKNGATSKEVRAVKAVYGNAYNSRAVTYEVATAVYMSGNNVQVEWGGIVSHGTATIADKLHPTYRAVAGIDLDTNGPWPLNNDPNNWWWHSYDTTVPPFPTINTEAYKALAIGPDPAHPLKDHCNNNFYTAGSYDKKSFTDCNKKQDNGNTYYIGGNWSDFNSAFTGNIIVMGDLAFSNGKQPSVDAYDAVVPPFAWKEYCNDWAAYQAYDTYAVGKPACFGSLNYNYQASGVTYNIAPSIHGFVYVAGNFSIPNGGGNSNLLHGVLLVKGVADVQSNSHAHVYFDSSTMAGIQVLSYGAPRVSWGDTVYKWPSSLP
ncbi:MAG: hypothetical protein NTX59_01905 [Elusimicrobia bacterium]|nr:hypothetical protein [Elusimicrobiota bacterium]